MVSVRFGRRSAARVGHAVPPGEATARLDHLGHLYAVGIRLATVVPVAIVGAVASTRATAESTTVVLTLVALTTAGYVYGLLRGRAAWTVLVDACGLMVLALSTPLTVPAGWLADGKSWLIPFITTACVAYQYHLRPLLGAVLAVTVHAALAIGVILAIPAGAPPFSIISVCWSLIIAGLGRMLWELVRRGGSRADAAMAQAERLRIRGEVASAVRADERALTNALHDTAATTLLMVGLGQVPTDIGVLRRQARRDLDVLATYGNRSSDQLDLASLIRSGVDFAPQRVDVDCGADLHLPGPVASAIADATAEAVRNAVRHARSDVITVRVSADTRSAGTIVATISDRGVGFDPDRIPLTRRGVRDSIRERMVGIGGSATITSCVGHGTTVRLTWPDD